MSDSAETTLARIDERVLAIRQSLGKLEATLEAEYVSKAEFDPVRRVVYGLVGAVLMGVTVALIALVVRQ